MKKISLILLAGAVLFTMTEGVEAASFFKGLSSFSQGLFGQQNKAALKEIKDSFRAPEKKFGYRIVPETEELDVFPLSSIHIVEGSTTPAGFVRF